MRSLFVCAALLALRESAAWVVLPMHSPSASSSSSFQLPHTISSRPSTTIAKSTRKSKATRIATRLNVISNDSNTNNNNSDTTDSEPLSSLSPTISLGRSAASLALCASLLVLWSPTVPPSPALAYVPTDYASETVQTAIQTLKEASNNNNVDATVKAYENIAEIIIEGKGVGGQINYQGVALDRGYVADEDTAIYNPGLTLLTESEKDRLVEAVVQSKQQVAAASSWNNDAQAGYDFLRERLDPLHMYELRGYLKIVPLYAAAVYLAVLAVQQQARDLFPVAYFVGVGAIFLPAVVLVALGPQ